MIPYKAIIIMSWLIANPAEPQDRMAKVFTATFPDKQICEVALAEKVAALTDYFREVPTVLIEGQCQPANAVGS